MIEPGKGAGRRVDADLAAKLAPEAVMLYAPPPPFAELRQARCGSACAWSTRDVTRIVLERPRDWRARIGSALDHRGADQFGHPPHRIRSAPLLRRRLGHGCDRHGGVSGGPEHRGTAGSKGCSTGRFKPGIVDRLLRLPVSFFRQYTAGDLADRALGIQSIRRLATSHAIRGLLAGVLALVSFVLMFFLNWQLAFIAAALTMLRGVMIVLTSVARLRRERLHFELDGKVQGLVLQFLTGVGKLRVASRRGARARRLGAKVRRPETAVRRLAALGKYAQRLRGRISDHRDPCDLRRSRPRSRPTRASIPDSFSHSLPRSASHWRRSASWRRPWARR